MKSRVASLQYFSLPIDEEQSWLSTIRPSCASLAPSYRARRSLGQAKLGDGGTGDTGARAALRVLVLMHRRSPPAPTTTAKTDRSQPPACCKTHVQVFQMFIGMLPVFLYGCCKSRLGCCNGYTCMLQLLFLIFHLFFQTYVASVFI
jgi:hypothetical protein